MSVKIEDVYYVLDSVKFNLRQKKASKKTEHFVVDEVKFNNIEGKDVWFILTRKSFFKPVALHDISINVAVCLTFAEAVGDTFVFDEWFNSLSEDYIDTLLYDVFANLSTLMSELTSFGYRTPLITAPSNYLERFKN